MQASPRAIRISVVLAGLGLAVWIGYGLRAVLNPLLLGALFAYILDPLVSWLERKGMGRVRAIVLLYLSGGLGLGLFLWTMGPPLLAQTVRSAERVQEYLKVRPGDEPATIARRIEDRLRRIPHFEEAADFLSAAQAERFQEWLVKVVTWAGRRATDTFRNAFTLLSYLLLVPLYTFYFLERFPILRSEVPGLIPVPYRRRTVSILRQIDVSMAGFFLGRTLVCLAKGLLVAVGLWIVDVPYAWVCGLLVAPASLVPAASFFGCGGLAMLLGWLGGGSQGALVAIVAIFAASEVIEAVAVPLILGRTSSLHPIMVVFAILAFGSLLGFFGVLLAVPLASATKILWREAIRPYIDRTWEGEAKGGGK